jgi:hypothetical protein
MRLIEYDQNLAAVCAIAPRRAPDARANFRKRHLIAYVLHKSVAVSGHAAPSGDLSAFRPDGDEPTKSVSEPGTAQRL